MDSMGGPQRAHRIADHHARAFSPRSEAASRLCQGTEIAGNRPAVSRRRRRLRRSVRGSKAAETRSEEHTSELQSLTNLVCRLLLEKKKKNIQTQSKTKSNKKKKTKY